MSDQDIFIGRVKELQMIKQLVSAPGDARHVVRIVGEGGVGKTWLLREVYRRYADDPTMIIIRIEYGETRFQSVQVVYLHVMEQFEPYLTEDQKVEYRLRLSEVDRFIGTGLSTERIQQKEDEVYAFGIHLVNLLVTARGHRILFLIDTVEALVATDHGIATKQRINRLLAQFEYARFIIASRPTENVLRAFDDTTGLEGLTLHELYHLQPFSLDEAALYLKETLPGDINPDLREKITSLTEGKPVLIAIASEWLRRHIALPSDMDLSLDELRALDEPTMKHKRKRFEFELIETIRMLRQPIDETLLYLAYLDRRYAPRILQLALDSDNETEIAAIIDELKTLVFVRKSMTVEGGLLHDEAKRLILEHAWPSLDPTGTMRQSLAQKVIDGYYKPEIERLGAIVQQKIRQGVEGETTTPDQSISKIIPDEEWLRWEHQIECLDYSTRIGNDTGWDYFETIFDEAYDRGSFIQLDMLMQAVNNTAPAWRETVHFQVRLAQVHMVKNERHHAEALAQQALNTPDIRPLDAIRAWDVLSGCTPDPVKQVEYLTHARERAETLQDNAWLVQILSYLGLAYRRQGNWNKAEESYEHALHLLNKQRDITQYANTLNNLAFVRMLKGDLEGADDAAHQALIIRKKLGNRLALAYSYSTMGRIAEEKGIYGQAEWHYERSVSLFTLEGRTDDAALRKLSLSASARAKHRFAEAHQFLADGLASSRDDVRALSLYHRAKVFRDEARALQNQDASHNDIAAKFHYSKQASKDALRLARKVQDAYLIARILLDMAVAAMLFEQRKDEAHIAELHQILETYNYTREQGRLIELMGDLAYGKQEYMAAFEQYINASDILFAYNKLVFEQTFSRVREKFYHLPPDVQQQVCQMVTEKMATSTNHAALARFKRLCDDTF